MPDLSNNEQLADGIVAPGAYEATRPPRKEFLPWHRPRKQFVREKQWALQIDKMLSEIPPQGQTLRYLGLPGSDLLDLRHFHETLCVPRQLSLRFLGFNSAANSEDSLQVELNISLDEVKKLPFIDPLSEILPDDVRRIANENSIAYRKAQNLGPYDVINLDLCDGFGGDEPGTIDDTHYKALGHLLSLQVRNKSPWLLLLTTRAGAAHIHAEVVDRLVKKCTKNLVNCPEFREAVEKTFSVHDPASFEEMTKTPAGLLVGFLVGISKWLLSLAVDNNPQASMELKSVIGYKVASASPCEDLVSLAFRFVPHTAPIADELGLATRVVPPVEECPLSAKIVGRVASRVNADDLLETDQALHKEMTDTMAALLAVARYNREAYYEWVEEGGY